ncbi:MAG: tetratricopeptide repeat protein [Gemmatimonadaceae bacterium]|nr:tetratricopeptide repeat protein [Gemmatimonadaceae bacterium]
MASSPAVLKQQAAALELKKQPEKALALYQQLLSEHGGSDDVDVSLRNRVGDLHLRIGQIDEAIALFEKSADEYALSGFLNNAIALCNKILRQRPGHVPTLRRLARFSAEKGMVVDAQRHYLSVAEALEKLGQHGEALKALSEFAELSPEDVHVRSVVVEQLLRAGRKPDALPHLTVLHRLHAVAGRSDEADGVAQVAREIDEEWVPESEQDRTGKRADPSLVLIASDDDFGALETSPMLGGDLERPNSTSSLEGLELTAPAAVEFDEMPTSGTLDGFEATSFEAPSSEPQEDVEPAYGSGPVESVQHDEPPLVAFADEIEFIDVDPGELVAPAMPAIPAPPAPPRLTPLNNAVIPPAPQSFTVDELPGIELGGDSDLPAFGTDSSSMEELGGLPMIGDAEVSLEAEASEVAVPDVDEPPAAPVDIAPPAPAPAPRPKRPTPSYVNLSDILHEDDEPKSARMTIGEPKQTGDQEADFQHILQEFRDGIEKTIPMDDADSHFDLGIAFREMGLIDDAIAEFQIASRSRLKRVESIEALGGCFLDKQEPAVARSLLSRALDDPSVAHGDDRLRGVLYLLGLASEQLGAREDGLRYYQRVYAVDIRFRDVAARIQTLQQPA